MSEIREICDALAELRVRRNWHLRNRMRLDSNSVAILRRAIDRRAMSDEKVKARALRIWAAITARRELALADFEVAEPFMPSLAANLDSRTLQEARRAEIDAEAIFWARQLPATEWVAGVKGFSIRGLAAIVGEAGDLGEYPHHRHLWKRLGLMPLNGHAGSQLAKHGASKEDWLAIGYVKRRRAMVRAEVEEPLFKWQIESAAKSQTPFGRAKGPYGEVYVARREFTARERPDWTLGHAKDDACRLMAKALIADLLSAWRGKHIRFLDAGRNVASPADLSRDAGGDFDAAA